VDRIYMDAVTRSPAGRVAAHRLLTPGGDPFFGGTYFPREARHGLPPSAACSGQYGMPGRLGGRGHCSRSRTGPAPGQPPPPPVLLPPEALRSSTGPSRGPSTDHGGFGGAQVPAGGQLEFLLRVAGANGLPRRADGRAGLAAMAPGASTTRPAAASPLLRRRALAHPHFEKMLYDNAYSPACTARGAGHGEIAFTTVARSTLDYLLPTSLCWGRFRRRRGRRQRG